MTSIVTSKARVCLRGRLRFARGPEPSRPKWPGTLARLAWAAAASTVELLDLRGSRIHAPSHLRKGFVAAGRGGGLLGRDG